MGALRVAVTSSITSASLVCWEPGLATILVHLDKVDSAIETARKLGDVDIEGNLLVLHVEHLIVVGVFHEVDTGSNVLRLRLRNELESKSVPASSNTVGASVICAVEGAVGSTGSGVRAGRLVPRISGVAVSVTGGRVKPTPVGVQDNSARL